VSGLFLCPNARRTWGVAGGRFSFSTGMAFQPPANTG
jgi:hypothetical protein